MTVLTGGLSIAQDTGQIDGSKDFTTLVILHGYVWHSGSFAKLIPIAKEHNTRLVLLHRRDYPGSTPFTEEELSCLRAGPGELGEQEEPEAEEKERVDGYMRDRAREVYDSLGDIVKRGGVVPIQPSGTGGIVVVGWSLASIWMNVLLAYGPTFQGEDVGLPKFLRRVVCYDPAYHIIGYPRLPDGYNPFFDTSLKEEERHEIFNRWITGYFSHGAELGTLERRIPLEEPAPIITQWTPEDIVSMTHPPPGTPYGSDSLLLRSGIRSGIFAANRKKALFFSDSDEGRADERTSRQHSWKDVELRYICCIQGLWESTYGAMLLGSELEEAKERGAPMRSFRMVRIVHGNHFAHWDYPSLAMKAFLEDDDMVE
ncbi:alpha/beta-hydrolase [Fomes fomentarius]|nr:alpha/beta-hydrolase [Fomes fomentarius]